ncbi:phosphatase PAP2 family protein [Streptomyces antarcticus]|uniref:phosphatase PAP2 family protein n=1 Tax=Streptomyces antarcticus TaxID=2996458 RepID=UPI0022711D80|nr:MULTISPECIES: phosphatase PAP2 family protein [unclassified Streptomyces]MCY0943295.1 phosphatase PAP2 family protein [Streptomyces sp. H34-AA3]MCY0951416.1 phosphatase PAP2 family protein [Streptomyces sp. H27-S2]MCZ4082515.1 phosphatase PAP2 family protein [Streptomyces sp. H34-S5]
MRALAALRDHDHRLTRRIAAWDSPWARLLLPPVEDAAEHTKLWWAAAVAMAAVGGPRGRRAAATGIAAMALAELLSDQVAKKLVERRRPPKEWIPHDGVEDRPDSSSFPSGHTAAALAFAAAVAPAWPAAGAACAVPALMVAVGRVHSGAHYPSDVAAGAAIGLASVGLVRSVLGLLSRRLPYGRGLSGGCRRRCGVVAP